MVEIKLFYLLQNGFDGSCWPRFFTSAEKRNAFAAAERADPEFGSEAVLGVGEVVLHVKPDGTLADPNEGTELWLKYPTHRRLDPVWEGA